MRMREARRRQKETEVCGVVVGGSRRLASLHLDS